MYTLCLSLYEERHQKALQRTLTRSLVKLCAFNRKWWDEFGEDIERDAGYRECGNSVDRSVWTVLVWQMFSDMDARTPGVRPFFDGDKRMAGEGGLLVGEMFGM